MEGMLGNICCQKILSQVNAISEEAKRIVDREDVSWVVVMGNQFKALRYKIEGDQELLSYV